MYHQPNAAGHHGQVGEDAHASKERIALPRDDLDGPERLGTRLDELIDVYQRRGAIAKHLLARASATCMPLVDLGKHTMALGATPGILGHTDRSSQVGFRANRPSGPAPHFDSL